MHRKKEEMKSLFFIEDTVANKISYFLIMLFLVCLPFDRLYSELCLITLSIHTLIHIKKARPLTQVFKTVVILQFVFFITLLGCIYSVNKDQGLSNCSKQLSIIIFPILLAINPLNLVRYKNKLLLSFAIGCAATITYLYYDAFHIMLFYKLPFKALFAPSFINQKFSLPIDAHATFLSMYCTVCLIYLLMRFLQTNSFYKKIFLAGLSTILLAGIIQLSSKSVFIAALLIINLCIPFYLARQKRLSYIIIVSSLSMLCITAIFRIDSLRNRFLTEMTYELAKNKKAADKEEYRMIRWEAAIDIIKESPIIGHGSGSEIELLKEKYFEKKLYNSYLHELNAHNQYLSFLINFGLIGLIVYLLTLAWGVREAIKNKDVMLLSFMILVIIVSLSEDLLDVNKGIFFYSFFFSYFVLSHNKKAIRKYYRGNNKPRQEIQYKQPALEYYINKD
jgi:O-antigen ligase